MKPLRALLAGGSLPHRQLLGVLWYQERELWEKIVLVRRPGWFSRAEAILESYVTAVTQVRRIESALRTAGSDLDDDYQKLARMHRHAWRSRPHWRRS